MKRNIPCCAVLLGLFLSLAPGLAEAQALDPANRDAAISSVSSTTTTSMVAGIVITLVLSSGEASIERYLRENAVALRGDITTGAGPTVDDLAELFEVSADEQRAFGRMLRTHRASLLPLVVPHNVTLVTTREFIAVVQSRRGSEPAQM